MKPGFALNLSQDGIGLLHRMADGWAKLGHASFDDPDFESRIAELPAQAAGIAPDGFTTKLILPASQILYCEVVAPGPDRASRRAQIAAALEGRTPYAVGDLAFDWCGNGRDVRVAVVAKVTLDEAEAFAESHGFNPVSFVTIPEANQFAGEPYFGMTRDGERHLPEGDQLTRDQDPVRIIAAAPAVPAQAKAPEPAPAKAPEPAASGKRVASEAAAEIEPIGTDSGDATTKIPDRSNDQTLTPETAPTLRQTPEPAPPPAAIASAIPDDDIEAPFIAVDDIPDPDPEEEVPGSPAPAFSSRRPSQPDSADRTDDVPGLAESRLHLLADPVALSAPPSLGPVVEIEEAGITAPILKIPQGREMDEDTPATGTRRPRSGLGRALMNTLPEGKHGTQAQQQARRSGDAGTSQAGVFGAPRQARTSPPARMRLGLILVAVLLLVMAAVALWSVWFAADPAPSAEAPAQTATPAAIAADDPPAPNPVAEAVADAMPPTPEPPAPVASDAAADPAAVPTEPLPDVAAADPLPDPGPAAPDQATLWDAAPAAATGPEADAPGAPTVAAAAPGPATPEAAITPLPAPDALAADDQPQPQPLPPPYGTEIEFGPDGLIRATPDGVVTPDGFTLISGRPPVAPAPAPRPDPAPAATPEATPEDQSGAAAPPSDAATAGLAPDAAASAVAEAMAALPDPVDPAHAAKKPRPRPAAIVQRAEAARAQAAAIAEAAEAAARAEVEALASATPAAVASSRRPMERPSSLAKAVEAAVSDAVTEAVSAPPPAPTEAPAPAPAAEPEEIDEPEPVQSVPNMPTTVTVAKQATVKNAIDLGKINLIGVYGSSSSRRALVRMPTGRLIKVKIGDRLDGGKVAAIGDSELTYVKNGRSYVLKMVEKG